MSTQSTSCLRRPLCQFVSGNDNYRCAALATRERKNAASRSADDSTFAGLEMHERKQEIRNCVSFSERGRE